MVAAALTDLDQLDIKALKALVSRSTGNVSKQFELLYLDGDLLTPGPEHHALQLLNDQAQAFDLMALRGERFEVCQKCFTWKSWRPRKPPLKQA